MLCWGKCEQCVSKYGDFKPMILLNISWDHWINVIQDVGMTAGQSGLLCVPCVSVMCLFSGSHRHPLLADDDWLTTIVLEISIQTYNGGVVPMVLTIWSFRFPVPSEGFIYTLNRPASLWHDTCHALFNVDISLRWCKGARWPSGGGPVPGEISPSTLNIFVWPNWQNESLSEDRHLGRYMGWVDLQAGGHPSLLMHCNCTNTLHIHCIRHCPSRQCLLWPGRSLSLHSSSNQTHGSNN